MNRHRYLKRFSSTGLHIATMLLMFGLLAVYAIDIFKNSAVREDRRVIWLVLVLFVNIGAMPVYWWQDMRKAGVIGA